MLRLCTLLTLLLFLLACGPTRGNLKSETDSDNATARRAIAGSRGANSVAVDAAQTGTDLTSYLRRIAGVSVRGSGPEATIRIRGDISLQSDTTPLFVVDGTILGNDFSSVYNAIDINEIARVRILKNVSDTNSYGMQGASGVIEIELK